ncbi:hypothetical protein, partial [Streptomyces ureilyticus]|uniref:hypothetical protein n=1 Tax=Streptomyces ureilyticus TaxID=1775131 RepID=UPI001F425F99
CTVSRRRTVAASSVRRSRRRAGSRPSRCGAGDSDGSGGEGDSTGDRRIHMPTGYEMHPWADLRPAGEGPASGRKLWHQSPGSAG